MEKKSNKSLFKKIWYFIWEDNSIWSWIVNIALAFALIKFIVYPGLGLFLGTNYPIVAVVSESMEHNNLNFDDWWQVNHEWYENKGITKQDFNEYALKNGFKKGDIIILNGVPPQDLKTGDVVVFKARQPDPVIHRIVKKWEEQDEYYFQTKGDNNPSSISNHDIDEMRISEKQIIGKAVFKIPYLGYIKIWFVDLINLFVQ
jgi:signal peptidase I